MKNILNARKNSLKSILMSLVIFFSSVVSLPFVFKQKAAASIQNELLQKEDKENNNELVPLEEEEEDKENNNELVHLEEEEEDKENNNEEEEEEEEEGEEEEANDTCGCIFI